MAAETRMALDTITMRLADGALPRDEGPFLEPELRR
jgi:hypothetical protein